MVVLLHYLRQEVPVGDIDRGVKPSTPRAECNKERDMDRAVIHVSLTDAQVVGRLVMGLWRPVDTRASWRRLVS
jgi:hypothetical protein